MISIANSVYVERHKLQFTCLAMMYKLHTITHI